MRKNHTIHPKVLKDVEFDQVLTQISDLAQSDEAKELIKKQKFVFE
jgi:hypothetical protein